jgi:hypothetical protein
MALAKGMKMLGGTLKGFSGTTPSLHMPHSGDIKIDMIRKDYDKMPPKN